MDLLDIFSFFMIHFTIALCVVVSVSNIESEETSSQIPMHSKLFIDGSQGCICLFMLLFSEGDCCANDNSLSFMRCGFCKHVTGYWFRC